jgi:RNA polymerase sigma factor (sigma-70 family)
MRQLSPDDLNSELDRNYEYYRQQMERGLVKQVYDRGRFDDLSQDTVVNVLTYFARHPEKLPQTDYHLGNLLRIMAVQGAINDGRKNRKSKDYVYLSDSKACEQLSEPMVEEEPDWIDRLTRQEAIAQLPQKLQDIVRLLLEGLNQKDIADELGIAKSTVNEYVKRIRAELRPKIYPVPEFKRVEASYFHQEFKRLADSLFICHKEFFTRYVPQDDKVRVLARWYVKEMVRILQETGDTRPTIREMLEAARQSKAD